MLKCFLYNFIRNKFQSLLEKVILGNLYFQLDNKLILSSKATTFQYSRELANLTQP